MIYDINYNYSKLLGKIKESGYTQEALAALINIGTSTLSQKLNNQSEFRQSEIQKICKILNIDNVEDYVRIILDIMRVNYGIRETRYEENSEDATAIIDFSVLPYDAMELNVEVGAGSYWSEITQIQTADNLFANGIIKDAALYLDSILDKYIKNKQKIIDKLNEQAQQPQLMPAQAPQLAEQVIM